MYTGQEGTAVSWPCHESRELVAAAGVRTCSWDGAVTGQEQPRFDLGPVTDSLGDGGQVLPQP